jgi:hypothetical protein
MGRAITLAGLDFTSTALNVRWSGLRLDGWDGSPQSTMALTQKPRDHGAWASEAFLTPRIVTLSGWVQGASPADITAAIDILNAAVDITAATLTVVDDGVAARSSSVARQGDVIFTSQSTNLVKQFSVQMVAKDPRKYGPTVTVGPVAPPSSSGGLTFAATFPLVFAATVTPGTIAFPNPGNVAAPCIIRIDGPTIGAAVTHSSTGAQMVFAETLTINTGEYLIVDMAARTARLMGQASRIGFVTSRGWFNLDPGANDIAYNGTGGTLSVTGPQGAWL